MDAKRLSERIPALARLTTLAAGLSITASAAASPTFLITQGSKLYRYQSGAVATFNLSSVVSGMTTVPAGVSVGNMNGGAVGGDVLAVVGSGVYRLDNPLGTPSLTLIGTPGGPNASPVFVNGRLFGVGGIAGPGSIVVEWDLSTFSQINQWATGVFGGPGGMVSVPGTPDEFYYAEFNNSAVYHYKLGDTFSTFVCSTPVNHYVGFEDYGGTIYASYALPGSQQFVFGTQSLTGTFNQLAVLDTYTVGITGLTWIVPAPGSAALLGVGAVLAGRRRRSRGG